MNMELFDGSNKLRSRLVRPQAYAITLERPMVGASVHLVVAFDLEEAIEKARQSLIQMMKMPVEEANNWKLNLFMRRELSDVMHEASEPIKASSSLKVSDEKLKRRTGESSAKNKLMQQIVANRDVALFKKSKKQFTEAEVKYLTDQLR